jgi:hypothetical protein
MTEKLKVNMDDLTLRELHEIRKLAGAPLEELMAGEDQALGLASIVCVMQRRTIPTFTLDDAWDMRLHDLEMVTADPETKGGSNGEAPQLSPESGTSIPSP